MPISQALLPEFDQEMANTRKTLERVPTGKWSWKPHDKSPTLGWLATHVASLPSWASVSISQDGVDIDPPDGNRQPMPKADTTDEVLALFDSSVAEARAAICSASDDVLMQPWKLLKGGQTLMSLPRAAVLRSFVMNHLIHHRAQLTVYLRLNDVPVPALYGPSADENPFA